MGGVAIVVFSDLVDSTALLARLGDDHMDTVRRAHIKDVTDAVALGDGRVIKTLGDGVMSTFESALGALRAAAAIQAAVERLDSYSRSAPGGDVRRSVTARRIQRESGRLYDGPRESGLSEQADAQRPDLGPDDVRRCGLAGATDRRQRGRSRYEQESTGCLPGSDPGHT